MIYLPEPKPAELVVKVNRFLCLVKIGGNKLSKAHIPNSGRLAELMRPGKRVLLERSLKAGRKTSFTLRSVWSNGRWVCVDSSVPNRLALELAESGSIRAFSGYENARREYSLGAHRFDMLLDGRGRAPMLVEVKSVTLVSGRVARFPDAPTERGRSHLEALAEHAAGGCKCAVLFVVQRSDADVFEPNRSADPGFADALKKAAAAGVKIEAVRCRVGPRAISVIGSIPARL